MRISDWSSDVCSSDLEQRFANMRIMFGQDLEPDMLLDDPLYCGGQRRQIVDVTGISENRPGQRPRLRPRIPMMRLRSEERRGGTGWVSTCKYRLSPDH